MDSNSVLITLCFLCNLIILSVCGECDVLPDMNYDEKCCDYPMLGDERIIMKCKRDFQGAKMSPLLEQCKVVECIFNELKITKGNDVDEPAVMNFFDTNVREANWKPIFKSTFKDCLKDITNKMPIITKTMESAPFNIKKDQCNVKYIAMVMCTEMKRFAKCPKENWTPKPECQKMKQFVENCGDNFITLLGKKVSGTK